MALSYNWTSMTTLVNNMSPGGNTNQAIGLALGWMSLVGGGPFPTHRRWTPSTQYQQVIILLTDGLNTQDRWYTNQASIDARRGMTCDNIKAGRHHALDRAGQYRRRSHLDAAAELRQRLEQVLPAHVVVADHHDVQPDRHRAIQPARRPIGASINTERASR